MEKTEQREKVERRAATALNAHPPYLTKQGPILFDRRSGQDRRRAAPPVDPQQAEQTLVEHAG